eukprot:TRINITY_DN1878_c6_g1_i1.p1 TRINITY_DN1878_c6_g1~~TRINITY_DN1878_c6_g1_i1.p1  ORF type:complete len:172 (+),score=13.46 TRINITY_DN1878_c6_g1_i1:52-516(+)
MAHKHSLVEDFDWWRDSTVRYAGYTNELGEAFRPLIPKAAVLSTYAVAVGYSAGDAFDKARSAKSAGATDKKAVSAFGIAALWQLLASVTIPAFFVNKQVALTRALLTSWKPSPVKTFAPTASGIMIIPILPFLLDPPITKFVDYAETHLPQGY